MRSNDILLGASYLFGNYLFITLCKPPRGQWVLQIPSWCIHFKRSSLCKDIENQKMQRTISEHDLSCQYPFKLYEWGEEKSSFHGVFASPFLLYRKYMSAMLEVAMTTDIKGLLEVCRLPHYSIKNTLKLFNCPHHILYSEEHHRHCLTEINLNPI